MKTIIDNNLITITLNQKFMYKSDWERLKKYVSSGIYGKARWDYYADFHKEQEEQNSQDK